MDKYSAYFEGFKAKESTHSGKRLITVVKQSELMRMSLDAVVEILVEQ